MSAVFFGILVLALLFAAVKAFVGADPGKLVPMVKTVGGIGALGGAALFAYRGQFGIAIPLGFAGLSLLGRMPSGIAGIFQRTRKSPGQTSRVRTAAVEMELDH